ncbi:hypothetical protein ACS127_10180 [Amphibacillus sp. Q70]|uniref:hypothetical protein n=1 Tax=Amphibacillus sp. Q70 TaxID=3453416 RepID=UPI003F868DB4
MSMTELESNMHEVRRKTNKQINKLASTAIEDSSTYGEAIKKLSEFRWKFSDTVSITIIESAIESVKERALDTEI